MVRPAQGRLVDDVRHEAHFHQDTGNIGRLQYHEGGMAGRILQQRQVMAEFATTPRAIRADPTRVSCRTRLDRMRATSGGALRKLGPPKRSAAFSRWARAAVCASDALSDRV